MAFLLLETGLLAEECVIYGFIVGFGILTVSWLVTNVYRGQSLVLVSINKDKKKNGIAEKTHHCMIWFGLHESTIEYPPKIPFLSA